MLLFVHKSVDTFFLYRHISFFISFVLLVFKVFNNINVIIRKLTPNDFLMKKFFENKSSFINDLEIK